MPKPTKAELLQRFPPKTEAMAATGVSGHTGLVQLQTGRIRSGGFGTKAPRVPASGFPVFLAQLDGFVTSSPSLSTSPSHSASSSLSPVVEPHSHSSSDDDDFSGRSDFDFLPGAYRQMCTPSEAKALSIATGRFYAITSLGRDGVAPGDDPQVDGMILHGYSDGKPVYYKYSGIHADLKAIETETVFGLRYVRQPVESCFGRLPADLDADSGYGSLQDSESTEGASGEVPPNRLFSNNWFKVGKSSLGGYGVFALKDIEPCTNILLEKPFMLLKNWNTLRQRYEKLSLEEKSVFDGLHAYAKNQTDELMQRVNANSFMLGGGECILAIASNFNHACHGKRNTQYHWDQSRRIMVFTTDSHVAAGEELLISYGEGRMVLQEKFGFLCNCGACDGLRGWTIDAFV